jgi:hypothetical protein
MRSTVVALLCLALAACGGGGGGGGGDNTPATVSVSISPASLNASFTAGQSVPVSVTATTSGAVNQTVFVTIVDTAGVVAPGVTIVPNSNTSYAVTLSTSPNLTAGTYTGTLRVNVCYDSGCSQHLGNSPLNVPYTFQVAAPNTYSATPTNVTLSQTVGAATQVTLTLTASQALSGTILPRLAPSPGLLDTGTSFTATGNGSFTATLTINPALNPGRSTDILRFFFCRDQACTQQVAGSPLDVPYDITILPIAASALSLDPAIVTGSYIAGARVTSGVVLNTPPLPRPVFGLLTDSQGVFAPNVFTVPNPDATQHGLIIRLADTITPGHYNGVATLTVCAAENCGISLATGTLNLSYDITVVPPVTFDPPTLSGRFSTGFPFAARTFLTNHTGDQLWLQPVDNDTFQPFLDYRNRNDGTYLFTVFAKPSLTPQHKTGSVSVRVCRDSSCLEELPNSPVSVAYDLTVEPLRALSRYPGVEDWETYQGNASHTGYVPITVDVDNIVPRWNWMTEHQANGIGGITTLAVDDGRVVISAEKFLHTLSEHDGTELWSRDFNDLEASPGEPRPVQLTSPAASGGNVYVATSGYAATFMWSFAANNGAQRFQSLFGAQWEYYFAPTLYDGTLYANCGDFGGLCAFDGTTGDSLFFSPLQQFDSWSPAVDANHVYAYIGGQIAFSPAQLNILDRNTGALVASIEDDSYEWAGYSVDTSPVIGAAGSVTAVNVSNSADNALLNFDTAGETIRWSVPGGYTGTPAYRNGVLYAVNRLPLRLEARSETDGALLWSWTPPFPSEHTFIGDVLVTDNIVFVSTNEFVWGVSLTTHDNVWGWPKPGRLALSANGVLYISTYAPSRDPNDGDIVAFDLNR